MARVAPSIFLGAGGDYWAALKRRGGTLKWYSLIDRGARDSVCERNSKKSPRDEGGRGGGGGCMVGGRERERRRGGVWWSGGTEPENCIACSVISLPPGSHSLSLSPLSLSSHSPGSFLPLVAFPRVFVLPLWLPLASFHFLCHYITLSLLSILSSSSRPLSFHFLGGYLHCLSSLSLSHPLLPPSFLLLLFSSLCADLALASILVLSSGLEKCIMPRNLQASPSKHYEVIMYFLVM